MKRRAQTRPQYLAPSTLMVVSALLQSANAQHSDVFISVDDNRIVVEEPFHADSIRSFDVLGNGSVWHGSNPGYSTTVPDQFKLNDEVNFDVVSPLLLSTGETWDVAGDDSYLRQFWSAFADLSVTADATTGSQPGFLVGSVGNRGTVHQHHTFELATYSGQAPREGAYAIQQVVVADGYVSSDPFWIVLNNGLPIAEFASTLRNLPSIGIEGDFDRNGLLDARDINRLRDKMFASSEVTKFTNEFDLTSDLRIDAADLEFWVRDVRHTWVGDSNLDGEFNSTDLIQVFGFGHYEDQVQANSGWEHGDWNADGEFDSGDLVVAFQDSGYERGPRAIAIPESHSPIAIVLFALAVPRVACRKENGLIIQRIQN